MFTLRLTAKTPSELGDILARLRDHEVIITTTPTKGVAGTQIVRVPPKRKPPKKHRAHSDSIEAFIDRVTPDIDSTFRLSDKMDQGEAAGYSRTGVRNAIRRMVDKGTLEKVSVGYYRRSTPLLPEGQTP